MTMDLDAYGVEGRSPWIEVDWSAHQRWVTVLQRPVNVVEIGSGPPILFVHGHAGAWQNWLEQLPVLAASHRCVAVDLPGFGASPMPRDGVTISGYAVILDALMDELGLDSAVVVGNSMGGFIAAELAIRFPARVERLVLVSSAGVATAYIRFPTWFMARYAERIIGAAAPLMTASEPQIRRMATRRGLRRGILGLICAHPERIAPELAYEVAVGSGAKPAAGAAAADLGRYDVRDRLGDIACPTLIVWGTRDRVAPPSGADAFERVIPDTRKVIFDDTGHVPMLERPVRFNALLEDFIAEAADEDVNETSSAAATA